MPKKQKSKKTKKQESKKAKKQKSKKAKKKVVKRKTTKKKPIRKVTKKKPKTRIPKTNIPAKLIKLLDGNKIKYEIIPHKVVFTAYDLAQTLKTKINEVTKTLVIKTDKDYLLAVLPGHLKLDFNKLKKLVKAKKIKIIPEKEMAKKFKIKPGAITPFGSLYKVPVYIESRLLKATKLLFQSGSFNQSIKMKIKDFVKLEKPTKGNFGKKK